MSLQASLMDILPPDTGLAAFCLFSKKKNIVSFESERYNIFKSEKKLKF